MFLKSSDTYPVLIRNDELREEFSSLDELADWLVENYSVGCDLLLTRPETIEEALIILHTCLPFDQLDVFVGSRQARSMMDVENLEEADPSWQSAMNAIKLRNLDRRIANLQQEREKLASA